MGKILVIGSSNVDMIMQMKRLPAPGETVADGTFTQTFGGKGANSAVASARAGGEVMFINCVGDDVYGSVMVDMYAEEGIDVSLISTENGVSSGTALIMIGENGVNCISVAPGANYRLTPDRLYSFEKAIQSADRIVLQCEIPLETNLLALELAQKHGIPVQLNLAPAMETPPGTFSKVDTLIVNEIEARFLMERAGLKRVPDNELAKALLVLGSPAVIVTLGADGAVVATETSVDQIPAYQVDVVDTTAAGDTFCGAIAVALVEGCDYGAAIRFASAASALSVGRLGAIPSVPERAEIDSFLRQHGSE